MRPEWWKGSRLLRLRRMDCSSLRFLTEVASSARRTDSLGLMVRSVAIAGAARPHGEERRAATRLEPWQQVRTRGHPSRRPRHSASKTRVTTLMARAPQDEVRGAKTHSLSG